MSERQASFWKIVWFNRKSRSVIRSDDQKWGDRLASIGIIHDGNNGQLTNCWEHYRCHLDHLNGGKMKGHTSRSGGGHFDGGLCVTHTLPCHCHPLTSDGPIDKGRDPGKGTATSSHLSYLRPLSRVRLPLTLSTIFCEALFLLVVVPQASSCSHSCPVFMFNLPVQWLQDPAEATKCEAICELSECVHHCIFYFLFVFFDLCIAMCRWEKASKRPPSTGRRHRGLAVLASIPQRNEVNECSSQKDDMSGPCAVSGSIVLVPCRAPFLFSLPYLLIVKKKSRSQVNEGNKWIQQIEINDHRVWQSIVFLSSCHRLHFTLQLHRSLVKGEYIKRAAMKQLATHHRRLIFGHFLVNWPGLTNFSDADPGQRPMLATQQWFI